MPEPVDFVWPYLASAAEGDELRYSIASVWRFFAGTPRIWVVCERADRPAWADNDVRFIGYRWAQGSRPTRRPFDSTDKLVVACRADGMGDHLVWMADDIYLIAPTTLPDIVGPRAAAEYTPESLRAWRPRKRHDRRHRKSAMIFTARHGRAWTFGTHTPYWFDRRRMLDAVEAHSLRRHDLLPETVYFNDLCHANGIESALPERWGRLAHRERDRPTVEQLERTTAGVLFLNHAHGGFTAEMQAFLRARIGLPEGGQADSGSTRTLDAGCSSLDALPLAVIMCTWQRPHWFADTLRMLEAQTYRDFTFLVWNNNPAIRKHLEQTIAEVSHTFDVVLHHSPTNIGPMGRTHLAHRLAGEGSFPYVVTIDDDQKLPPDFLGVLAAEAEPQTVSSTWAFRFRNGRSYWRRTNPGPGGACHYAGTGGAIWPIHLFADPAILGIPDRFRFIDDLWLSYHARGRGMRLLRSKVHHDGRPTDCRGLARRLRRRKDEFRRDLSIRFGIP